MTAVWWSGDSSIAECAVAISAASDTRLMRVTHFNVGVTLSERALQKALQLPMPHPVRSSEHVARAAASAEAARVVSVDAGESTDAAQFELESR